MIEINIDEQNNALKKSIKELVEANDLKYMYIEVGGTQKLYLFSESMGKGYCAILIL